MKLFSRIKASFLTRSFRVGSYSVAATVVVIAIAVVVNILAAALPDSIMEFDTTPNKVFTLSQQTEKLVKNLKQEVCVYLIARTGEEDTYIDMLLEKYKALDGKLTVEQKDPDLYPNFAEQYEEEYTENSLIVVCGDRYRYVDYYDIYVMDYEAYYSYGTEEWDFYGEQKLTSAIDFVISENLPKLYLLTGHGESSIPSAFSDAIDEENIETESLSLLTLEAVPEDADAVLVYAPQRDISEEEKGKQESYLAGGGNLIVLSDLPEEGALTNLNALMAAYGVTVNEGIVIEADQSHYAYGRPYYLLPQLEYHTITSPLVNEGYYVLMHTAQGLSVGDDVPDGVTVTELLTTFDKAFSKVAGYNISTYDKEEGDIEGPFALAVAIEDSNTESNVVWVSGSTLLNESNNSVVAGGNQDLFLNMINILCEPEGSSISIHAKSLDSQYLTMDSASSTMLTILMIGILPLGYLGFGIINWYWRKRR